MTSTKDQRSIIIKIIENFVWWRCLSRMEEGFSIFSEHNFSTAEFGRKNQKEKFCRLLIECKQKKLIEVRELYKNIKKKSNRTFRIRISESFENKLKENEDQLVLLVGSKVKKNTITKKLEFPFVDTLLKGIIKEFNPISI